MKTHVSGQAAVAAVAPTLHVGTYRRNILAIILDSPLFTPAEQLRANHHVHECQDAAQLARWLTNVRRVAAEREAADLAKAEPVTTPQPPASAPLVRPVAGPAAPAAQLSPAERPTEAQCAELYRVASLPCLTTLEKTQALLRLPRLTQAGLTRYLGELYAKVLQRTGHVLGRDGSTAFAA